MKLMRFHCSEGEDEEFCCKKRMGPLSSGPASEAVEMGSQRVV